MKVLVLGATGGTGRAVVQQLKEQGHEPVALVHTPSKTQGLQATIVQGDARNEDGLYAALDGCEAVISALGTPPSPFKEVTLLSTATRALVRTMNRRGLKRLVCITGIGAGDSRGHGGFLFDRILMPLLLRKVYADKDRQEAIVAESNLDWILVRPAILNNKPLRGNVRTLTKLDEFHGGTISRSDVADFVVGQIVSDAFLKKRPLIAW